MLMLCCIGGVVGLNSVPDGSVLFVVLHMILGHQLFPILSSHILKHCAGRRGEELILLQIL